MRFKTAISAAEIQRHCAALLQATGPANWPLPSLKIESIDSPDLSGPGSLTFLGKGSSLRLREQVVAALILAEPGVTAPEGIPLFQVHSVHAAMSLLLKTFAANFDRPEPFRIGSGVPASAENRIERSAVVEGYLEGDVVVGAGAFIGRGSYIGSGTRIEANAVVQENCRIGRNCVIQSGAVIGCAGFGFYPGDRGLQAMPHPAGVEIGDDCWIGANTVVAAGVLNPTTLGRGCKLDSHVQIAHNVRLGENALLASQSGIAGSTVVGKRFQMGGAASLDGHLRIGDDVSVAACSGVTKDQPDKAVVAGFPARPISEWRHEKIALRRMGKGLRKG